jgi:hypothetical protein
MWHSLSGNAQFWPRVFHGTLPCRHGATGQRGAHQAHQAQLSHFLDRCRCWLFFNAGHELEAIAGEVASELSGLARHVLLIGASRYARSIFHAPNDIYLRNSSDSQALQSPITRTFPT